MKIEVRDSNIHGKGVFAKQFIKRGEILEECHYIKLQENDYNKVDIELRKYIFAWPIYTNDSMVIALGYGSIYNHSKKNNATWKTDLDKNCFIFYAIKDIKMDEEIFIDYMYNLNDLKTI
jgi:SET domain-containing protein